MESPATSPARERSSSPPKRRPVSLLKSYAVDEGTPIDYTTSKSGEDRQLNNKNKEDKKEEEKEKEEEEEEVGDLPQTQEIDWNMRNHPLDSEVATVAAHRQQQEERQKEQAEKIDLRPPAKFPWRSASREALPPMTPPDQRRGDVDEDEDGELPTVTLLRKDLDRDLEAAGRNRPRTRSTRTPPKSDNQ
jgi:hypothetical protein